MPKFFIKDEQIQNNNIIIVGEDVKHITNVLRMKENEEITICNIDTSQNYKCIIKVFTKDNIQCEILNKEEYTTEPNVQITIFQALPKAEKMEFIIQKCTEIGVSEFVPVTMNRCVVKIDNKNEIKKIDRWKKIAESAAKQSGRDAIPKVENVINFQKLCQLVEKYDIVLIAYEKENENTLKNEIRNLKKKDLKVALVIGPEGGIEENEINSIKQVGAKIITLGKRILRTETAAIYLSSVIIYELD
jgi:16S rRNA (uracil1498-N3)-methyltransferase